MPKPSKRENLRETLLLHAEAMIELRGSQALRARDLTEAAGCALGALYNVFPDMDALVMAVKLRILDQLDEIMRGIGAGFDKNQAGQANTRLLALADAYLDFATTHSQRWQTLFKHQLSARHALPEAYFARLAEIFAHVEQPLLALLPGAAPEMRAMTGRALFSAVHGIVLLGLEQRLGETSPAMIRAQFHWLVDSALRGILRSATVPVAS